LIGRGLSGSRRRQHGKLNLCLVRLDRHAGLAYGLNECASGWLRLGNDAETAGASIAVLIRITFNLTRMA
jgi:hypothetical protein